MGAFSSSHDMMMAWVWQNSFLFQEKRRKRNTTIAASESSNAATSPTLIRTASVRKINNSSVGGKFVL